VLEQRRLHGGVDLSADRVIVVEAHLPLSGVDVHVDRVAGHRQKRVTKG